MQKLDSAMVEAQRKLKEAVISFLQNMHIVSNTSKRSLLSMLSTFKSWLIFPTCYMPGLGNTVSHFICFDYDRIYYNKHFDAVKYPPVLLSYLGLDVLLVGKY